MTSLRSLRFRGVFHSLSHHDGGVQHSAAVDGAHDRAVYAPGPGRRHGPALSASQRSVSRAERNWGFVRVTSRRNCSSLMAPSCSDAHVSSCYSLRSLLPHRFSCVLRHRPLHGDTAYPASQFMPESLYPPDDSQWTLPPPPPPRYRSGGAGNVCDFTCQASHHTADESGSSP